MDAFRFYFVAVTCHATSGDGDVISACISKDAFMKAPDESSIKKDSPEKVTEWITAGGKRCTDGVVLPQKYYSKGVLVLTPSLKSRAGDTAPDFWCFRRFCCLLPVSCPPPTYPPSLFLLSTTMWLWLGGGD